MKSDKEWIESLVNSKLELKITNTTFREQVEELHYKYSIYYEAEVAKYNKLYKQPDIESIVRARIYVFYKIVQDLRNLDHLEGKNMSLNFNEPTSSSVD